MNSETPERQKRYPLQIGHHFGGKITVLDQSEVSLPVEKSRRDFADPLRSYSV